MLKKMVSLIKMTMKLEMLDDCKLVYMAKSLPVMYVVVNDTVVGEMPFNVTTTKKNGEIKVGIKFGTDMVIRGPIPGTIEYVYLVIDNQKYFRWATPWKLTLEDEETLTLEFGGGQPHMWYGYQEDYYTYKLVKKEIK